MSDESCVKIEIVKEIPFFGKNSLETRLRNVRLKGFPDVKIYEKLFNYLLIYNRLNFIIFKFVDIDIIKI